MLLLCSPLHIELWHTLIQDWNTTLLELVPKTYSGVSERDIALELICFQFQD